MKKIISMLLVMVMSVSLVACGGPDKQPAIDAFNEASTAFNAVAVVMNENPDAFPDEAFDVMIQMSDILSQHKALLEGDQEISEEKLNEMIAWYNEVDEWVAEVKAEYGIE